MCHAAELAVVPTRSLAAQHLPVLQLQGLRPAPSLSVSCPPTAPVTTSHALFLQVCVCECMSGCECVCECACVSVCECVCVCSLDSVPCQTSPWPLPSLGRVSRPCRRLRVDVRVENEPNHPRRARVFTDPCSLCDSLRTSSMTCLHARSPSSLT